MSQYQICKEINDYEISIKLDLNEFDFEHHSDVYKYICDSVIKPKSITHYSNVYNDNTNMLISQLHNYNSIHSNQILLSAGSDDSLEYLIQRYIKSDTHVFVFAPSYSYFECVIKRQTKNIHYIPLDFNNTDDLDIDVCLEFYKEYLDNSVVYIVNPNNPLGTFISYESIKRVIAKYTDTLFIIDEAYIEFNFAKTCVNLVNDNKNIVITRTFSKAYGLAGIRLGYMIAHSETLDYIKILYNEKNVTDLAKSGGIAIFKNIDYYETIIKEICDIRQYFQSFLDELNIYYVPSQSNFVSFYVGNSISEVLELLEKNSVYIRNRDTQIDMAGFVRITIGTKEHITKVCNIIKDNIRLFDSYPLVKMYTSKHRIWKLKLLLKNVVEKLNDIGITYWLTGESLLGVHKYNGILPWTNHIDIGIMSHDKNLLTRINDFDNNDNQIKDKDDVYIQFIEYTPQNDSLMGKNSMMYQLDVFPLESIKLYNILDMFVPIHIENLLNNLNFDYENKIFLNDKEFSIRNSFSA